jgi:diguanylate cyclase (GGDEF)-like protein
MRKHHEMDIAMPARRHGGNVGARSAQDEQDRSKSMASGHGRSNAGQQQIDTFMDTIARLKRKVVWLEREVAQAYHFACHDQLTGLPNRRLLRDRLSQAVVQATRRQKQVALLLLDLDGFKSVNDRLGHMIGDKLLQRIAERLISSIRGGDTACRYGGDEFVILLAEVEDAESALAVARKLHAHLTKQPYFVDEHSFAITASIGIAVHPCDGSSHEDLISRADTAMYLAKSRNDSPLLVL